MSFDFSTIRLDQLGPIITGKTPSNSIENAYATSGTPFITPKDMDGRKWIDTTERYLSGSGLDAVKKALVPSNSVSVSCIGSDMGKAVLVEQDSVTNQQINTILVDSEIWNPEYIYYLLTTKQQLLKDIAGGSATPILNKGHFGKVEINVPSKKIQDEVAKILSALDEKIRLNELTNQTLEQIAQAIFKSWFVDFEPVRAKMAVLEAGGSAEQAELAAMLAISAKDEVTLKQLQAEQPEAYAELAQTAALFPSKMVDSELGEIPQGWDTGVIEDVAQFSTRRIQVSELNMENYVSTENMLENKKGITTASSIPSGGTVPEFNEGDILVSNIRPYFKKIWLAKFKGGRSPDVLGFSCLDENEIYFTYNLLYQDRFFAYMMATSKGAKMPRGDKDAIKLFSFPLPQKEMRIQYSQKIRAFYPWIKKSNDQIDELQALKDTLLPKLLSGELPIPEINEVRRFGNA